MARKPVKTLHPLAVVASLEAQNQAVAMLLGAVDTILTFNPEMKGADTLRQRRDECRTAFYPDEDSAP